MVKENEEIKKINNISITRELVYIYRAYSPNGIKLNEDLDLSKVEKACEENKWYVEPPAKPNSLQGYITFFNELLKTTEELDITVEEGVSIVAVKHFCSFVDDDKYYAYVDGNKLTVGYKFNNETGEASWGAECVVTNLSEEWTEKQFDIIKTFNQAGYNLSDY